MNVAGDLMDMLLTPHAIDVEVDQVGGHSLISLRGFHFNNHDLVLGEVEIEVEVKVGREEKVTLNLPLQGSGEAPDDLFLLPLYPWNV